MGNGVDDAALRNLPTMFTYTQARRDGLSDRHLRRWCDRGMVERVSRGLYRRAGTDTLADLDLEEIARRASGSTICLTSALARHGLTDEIPATIDIALPRGKHRPVTSALVTWHLFDPATFDIGRSDMWVGGHTTIGLYVPQRCIIDAIRLRHREGPDLATVALRRWLTLRGASPGELLEMAVQFPQAQRMLRQMLEILL